MLLVMSDCWWDWRCGCGRSARRCGVRAARLVGGKAARDGDVPNERFDTARDAGDSTGQCSATEYGCLGGIAMIEQPVLGLHEVDETQVALVGGKAGDEGGKRVAPDLFGVVRIDHAA